MLLLENYIKYNVFNNKIYFNDLDIEYFGYDSLDEMDLDLNFLVSTLFENYSIIYEIDDNEFNNISIDNPRFGQKSFRENLINKYGKCVISGCKSSKEIQAAHIIPHCEDRKNFFISNGLLLKSNLHTTFDSYYWTINPDSFIIEINKNIYIDELGEIQYYEGRMVNLEKNDKLLYNNLQKRYQDFRNKINQ